MMGVYRVTQKSKTVFSHKALKLGVGGPFRRGALVIGSKHSCYLVTGSRFSFRFSNRINVTTDVPIYA